MIVFDTETTGLPEPEARDLSKQPQIIEFAGIKLDNKTLREKGRLEFLCSPGIPLPDVIVKITGITDDDLKGKPPFPAFYPQLCDFFLGETMMVAHNLPFDRDLLKFELMRMGSVLQFPWPHKHTCTGDLTSHWNNGTRLHLWQLYHRATGKEHKGAHRAMADVKALVEVVKWLRGKEMI